MSEERLQEIKDSVNFQKEILLAHNMETLCVDEEQELIEEIERLNNIINELEHHLYQEWLEWKDSDCESIYSRAGEDKVIYDYLQELKGSEKE